MELNRFDIAMTGADIGKLCDAMFQADPDLKAFVTELLNMAEEQSGEKLPIDLDDISGVIQSGLDEAGIGLEMDVSCGWTHEPWATQTPRRSRNPSR
jgi:hypothetical protein